MAANYSVADLTTARDNLITAYTTISTSPTKQYTLGDRLFTYETRHELWEEIERLTRLILLRTTGNSANARGYNRMDFKSWN
jgi:hypothetical protein